MIVELTGNGQPASTTPRPDLVKPNVVSNPSGVIPTNTPPPTDYGATSISPESTPSTQETQETTPSLWEMFKAWINEKVGQTLNDAGTLPHTGEAAATPQIAPIGAQIETSPPEPVRTEVLSRKNGLGTQDLLPTFSMNQLTLNYGAIVGVKP